VKRGNGRKSGEVSRKRDFSSPMEIPTSVFFKGNSSEDSFRQQGKRRREKSGRSWIKKKRTGGPPILLITQKGKVQFPANGEKKVELVPIRKKGGGGASRTKPEGGGTKAPTRILEQGEKTGTHCVIIRGKKDLQPGRNIKGRRGIQPVPPPQEYSVVLTATRGEGRGGQRGRPHMKEKNWEAAIFPNGSLHLGRQKGRLRIGQLGKKESNGSCKFGQGGGTKALFGPKKGRGSSICEKTGRVGRVGGGGRETWLFIYPPA